MKHKPREQMTAMQIVDGIAMIFNIDVTSRQRFNDKADDYMLTKIKGLLADQKASLIQMFRECVGEQNSNIDITNWERERILKRLDEWLKEDAPVDRVFKNTRSTGQESSQVSHREGPVIITITPEAARILNPKHATHKKKHKDCIYCKAIVVRDRSFDAKKFLKLAKEMQRIEKEEK